MTLLQSRSVLEERTIEFDGLAIAILLLAFAGVGAVVFWIVSSATQTVGPGTFLASALIGLGAVIAWILGYPRRAAIPAMSFVFVCALAWLPFFFQMDGALLREAVGVPASRLYVVIGLYVGGMGVILLAFAIFGFVGPFVGALLALRRGIAGARATLALHIALAIGATLVLLVSRVF